MNPRQPSYEPRALKAHVHGIAHAELSAKSYEFESFSGQFS